VEIDTVGEVGTPDARAIDTALTQLAGQYDATHGGFGSAPKFPNPSILRFLLREGCRRDDDAALRMLEQTLQAMAEGGINDHLGGGFCRYSVDEQWMIPHFEKMLYDNGQLLALYAEAWAARGRRPLFRHVCERTAEWVMREMQSPAGGYYASLDADSEGEEGRYYVWTPADVVALLDDAEYRVFAPRFGLDRAANFEGHWHLHTFADTAAIAATTGIAPREVRRLLASARDKLLAARERRVRPGRDEKILTSWNALMIRGMATAGRLLDRPDWLQSAGRALDHLYRDHWIDGRLLATSRDGKARLNAYLDDHAYLIEAILAVLQARWDTDLLHFACQLADRLLEHFADPETGGFFFTADDHETLVHRPRPLSDDAVPSGNGIAIEVLHELAVLTGNPRYQAAAGKAIRAAWPAMNDAPAAHVGLLQALRAHLEPPEQIVIRGEPPALDHWRRTATSRHLPHRSVYAVPLSASGLPRGLAAKACGPGETLAYRCRGTHCDPPLSDIASLDRVPEEAAGDMPTP